MSVDGRTCRSCGAPVEARFCSACGERWIPEQGEGLHQVVGTWLGDFLGTDGRIWRTMAAAVFRPGLLTDDYLRGRRQPWLRPLQLFVVCNVLYFLLQPFTSFNAFASTLQVQLEFQGYSESIRPTVDTWRAERSRELAAKGVEPELAEAMADELLNARFDRTFQGLSKAALILLVPLLALGVALVTPRAGPSFWLVFSLHYTAAVLLAVHLAWAFVTRLVLEALQLEQGPLRWVMTEGAALGISVLWAACALRRLRSYAWWRAVLSGLLLGVWFLIAMISYRYALFWWTWSVVT
ncbi:DUF3667 domain-containing protein [Engelhardtia mirabilis]|uniref:DUF3667 domain-containing protein n=1 Tax=Engelhardtia mirabilis TaxID=2528011 RepID=A0A518BG81_9BACT|nr:hypothetical protein Pla133_10460 [Planctomycetes bacterium Pla133]QDV00306.1 hypothetical protein Pla86_10450 [Planctomycetes bacterium Pla86]